MKQTNSSKKIRNYVMVTGSSINSCKDSQNSDIKIYDDNIKSRRAAWRTRNQENPHKQKHIVSYRIQKQQNFGEILQGHQSSKLIDNSYLLDKHLIIQNKQSTTNKTRADININNSHGIKIKKKTTPNLSGGKRVKTEDVMTSASPARRMNTEYTVNQEARFEEDHHNTDSLAQLLYSHLSARNGLIDNNSIEKYNEQIYARERKYEEDYENDNQKYSQVSQSEKQSKVESKISIKGEQSDEEEEDENEDAEEGNHKKIKNAKKNKKNNKNNENNENRNQILSSNTQTYNNQDDSQNFTGYTYIDGYRQSSSMNNKLKEEQRQMKGQKKLFNKKRNMRGYSLQEKMKILQDAKYVPKTQQEIRMQQRFINGQKKIITGIRQTEQFQALLQNYQKNKQKIKQQSMKKSQSAKLIQHLKSQVHRSSSLPKIHKKISILQNQNVQNYINDQKNNQNNKISENQERLSINNFVTCKKQRRLATQMIRNIRSEKQEEKQIQYIQEMFKNKGIQYDGDTLRKGLKTLKTLPNCQPVDKIQLPRGLISNPRYKQYPL